MTGIRQSWTALTLAIAVIVGVALAFVVATVVLANGFQPDGGYSQPDLALMASVLGGPLIAALAIATVVFAVDALQRTTIPSVKLRSYLALGLLVVAVLLAIRPVTTYLMLP